MDEFIPDKSKFKDGKNGYMTMMLFLETTQDVSRAIYTLADYDKTRDGVVYPSLRRLYLEMEDPAEYEFANKYLWGWDHWQKIVNNQSLFEYIRLWREELEVKLRARGIRAVIEQADKNFNAAKWVADGHWNVRRGRPSKEEIERERKIREKAVGETESDAARIGNVIDMQKRKERNGET